MSTPFAAPWGGAGRPAEPEDDSDPDSPAHHPSTAAEPASAPSAAC